MEILAGDDRIFCPWMGLEEVMSPGGIVFWAKCIRVLDGFVFWKRKMNIGACYACPIRDYNLFLRIGKKVPNIESRGRKAKCPRIH